MLAPALRLAALACALGGLGAAVLAVPPGPACAGAVGDCAQPGLRRCGATLGDWRVERSRESGLDPARSHSACVLASEAGAAPAVSLAPQDPSVSGDTLVSRAAAPRRDAQRATVRLAVHGALPDHWAFAVAGTFLERDTPTGCAALGLAPPVNAGYALIGGNWDSRPHGFYFERLADACVYDGTRDACPGDAPFVAHEFVPGEVFLLTLGLQADDDGRWWLDAEVAGEAPGRSAATAAPTRRVLGTLRRAVEPPCWLADGDSGRALVVVIPSPDRSSRVPGVRVAVADFAWRR